MRVVVARPERGVCVVERARPVCGDGQVLVRASCSLISPGTELTYADKVKRGELPEMPLGYCSSGIVEEVGRGVSDFAPRDRVIAMGWQQATHAEHIAVAQRLCLRIPADLAFEEAVFACLGATAVHACDRARLVKGERALVLGAGLLGQLTLQVAAQRLNEVWLVDPLASRLQIARSADAAHVLDWRGDLAGTLAALSERVDVVFLCMGGDLSESFAPILSALARDPDGKPRGRLVVVGRLTASLELNAELGNVDLVNVARCGLGYRDAAYELGRRDYQPVVGEGTVDDNLRRALRAIQSGWLRVRPLRTRGFAIAEAEQAYRGLRERPSETLGVTLHYINQLEH